MNRIINRILTAPLLFPLRKLGSYILSKVYIESWATLHTNQFLKVDLSSTVGRSIWLRGKYEIEVNKLILKILKEGDVFFDIGANVGYFSIVASSIVGSSGKIYAFEPSGRIYNLLCESIQRNNLKNVVPVNSAVGNENGKIFFIDLQSSAFSYVSVSKNPINSGTSNNKRRSGFANPQEVKLQTIDDYVRTNQIKKLSLLKIDVEGYEYKVLLGAKGVIQKFLPDLIVEVQDHTLARYKDVPEYVFSFLKDFGYSGYELEHLMKVEPNYCKGRSGACNIIFTIRKL